MRQTKLIFSENPPGSYQGGGFFPKGAALPRTDHRKTGMPERQVPIPGAFRPMVQCLFCPQTFTALVCGPAASC